MKIQLAQPCFDAGAIEKVSNLLVAGTIAGGEQVALFESEFAQYLGCSVACVSSGTTALFLAGKVLGLSPKDTILVSGFSFIASASAFSPSTIVPVDVNLETNNIDSQDLKRVLRDYPRAKALVVVDLYGNTSGTDQAIEIARDNGLVIIEDACQAHGAHDASGRKIGLRADATVFSFYATKNIGAGEGGCVASPNPDIIEQVRILRAHGSKDAMTFPFPSLNFRMTDIAAQLCRIQLPQLDSNNHLRHINARKLNSAFANKDIRTPTFSESTHSMHQYTLVFPSRSQRDQYQQAISDRGIESRVFYPYTISSQPWVTARDLANSQQLSQTVLSIPVHPQVDIDELIRVLA